MENVRKDQLDDDSGGRWSRRPLGMTAMLLFPVGVSVIGDILVRCESVSVSLRK